MYLQTFMLLAQEAGLDPAVEPQAAQTIRTPDQSTLTLGFHICPYASLERKGCAIQETITYYIT